MLTLCLLSQMGCLMLFMDVMAVLGKPSGRAAKFRAICFRVQCSDSSFGRAFDRHRSPTTAAEVINTAARNGVGFLCEDLTSRSEWTLPFALQNLAHLMGNSRDRERGGKGRNTVTLMCTLLHAQPDTAYRWWRRLGRLRSKCHHMV